MRKVVAVTAVVLAVVIVAVLFLLDPSGYRVPSESMQPTFEVGERIMVTGGFSPGRGDIVVLHPPAGAVDNECGTEHSRRSICPRPTRERADVRFIERVVALPGDRVKMLDGALYVNGERQREPYARLEDPECDVCNLPEEVTIPDAHYLVMGDNRSASADSRFWGPVPEDSIVGKVRLRYWPLGRIGSP